MKRLLVTAAGGGASNNLIRGIRDSRYASYIVGTSIDRFYLARSLADKNYLVPRGDAGDAYVQAIKRIVDEEGIDLIVANNDAEVGPISRYRDEFGTRVFLPSYETIQLCQDKFTLNAHLSAHGFRVAETYALGSLGDIEQAFDLLKDHDRLWCRMRKGAASKGSLPVKTPEQVRFWIQYWHEMRGVPTDRFLLSEYLPGRDYAFQSLWQDGRLVLAKTCERLVYLVGEWMPSGTSSTPRVGKLVNNPMVNDVCTRAVQSIDPQATGMFCIDLKEDRNGTPCITEINIGRFFMITPVFNSAGRHNMVELYLALAFGENVVIEDRERYGDIGSEETFLVRELDNEPAVLTGEQIEGNYTSVC
jgi:predicted ATP-grasp superfamily ATP-dependent carboligase